MHRRTLLGLVGASIGAGVVVAGCTSTPDPDGQPTHTSQPTSTEDLDNSLRRTVRAQELALISVYDQAISLYPQLTASLRPLADQHRQHHDALAAPSATSDEAADLNATEDLDQSESEETEPTTPGDATGLPTNDGPGALAALAAAERVAADQRTDSCVAAQLPTLARLLALIAASEASHAEALTRGGAS